MDIYYLLSLILTVRVAAVNVSAKHVTILL